MKMFTAILKILLLIKVVLLITVGVFFLTSNAMAKTERTFNLNDVTQSLINNSKKSPIDIAQSKTLMEYGGQDIAHNNPSGSTLDSRVLVG